MSIRRRWALTLGVVAAVAIGLSIGATLALTSRQLTRQVDSELEARARIVAENPRRVLRPLIAGDEGPGLAGLDAIFRVVTVNGNVEVSSPNDPGFPIETNGSRFQTVQHEGRTYRLISQPVTLRNVDVMVHIAFDVSRERHAIRLLIRRLGLIGVIGVGMAAWVGWLLAGKATAPIRRLATAAADIARTERLDTPLNVESGDEVGDLARSFQSMLTSLADSRRQQQRLISSASHELRTPLTALRTNLETLSRSFDRLDPGQREELLAAAVAEAQELGDLSAELVDLATDVRHTDEPTEIIDLTDLANEVVQRFIRRTPTVITVTGEGGRVEGRRSQLDRAISNLVANAVKWTPADGRIEVVLERGRLTVLDTGPGIPPGDLPHIFERFYRADVARTTPGSGLGLAIVEHVVSAHGGRVFAANRPQGGAEVGFELDGG